VATFSPCFGAPFLSLPPSRYAQLLSEKIDRHRPGLWLVNTGWTGGPYGIGSRIKLAYTRAMLNAALNGSLESAPVAIDPVFGFDVPSVVPGVPDGVLHPRATWADQDAYDRQARDLVGKFRQNILRLAEVPAEVAAAGPQT
jgi:phosphoenolpyruvate carboxykinase (ATP)